MAGPSQNFEEALRDYHQFIKAKNDLVKPKRPKKGYNRIHNMINMSRYYEQECVYWEKYGNIMKANKIQDEYTKFLANVASRNVKNSKWTKQIADSIINKELIA